MTLVFVLLAVPLASGYLNPEDPWKRSSKVRGDGGEFGATVVVDGDTMVVGHPLEDDETAVVGFNVGAVTVYERHTGGDWVEQATFYGEQPRSRLGTAITLDGDTFVTNAPGQMITRSDGVTRCPYSTAELYVYERTGSGWERTEILQPDSVEEGFSCLGGALTATHALSLDGDLLAAGAPVVEGTAYVYDRGGGDWSLQQNLTRAGDESFGRVDVSEEAERLAVGSTQTEADDGRWVAVDVYDRTGTGWNRTATLESADRIAGFRVELSEDGATVATIGSPWSGHRRVPYVPIHVWEEGGSGWKHVAELWPQDLNDRNPWMSDLELSADGETLAVGAWVDDATPGLVPELRREVPIGVATIRTGSGPEDVVSPFGKGAAYVFRTNETGEWEQTAKLTPRDEVGANRFGWDVALDQDRFVVGAPDDRGNLTDPNYYQGGPKGAVYVFNASTLAGSITSGMDGSSIPLS